jgi:hypothetical protein
VPKPGRSSIDSPRGKLTVKKVNIGHIIEFGEQLECRSADVLV